MDDSGRVIIYTDGACRGNPGPGGWGAWLRYQGHERVLKGAASNTTNNRMELSAAIEALAALKQPSRVDLYTDSQYVKKGISEWLPGWKARGWKTAARKPVKNAELWQRLDQVAVQHDVRWLWVRGHSGDEGNEMADRIANEAIDEMPATGCRLADCPNVSYVNGVTYECTRHVVSLTAPGSTDIDDTYGRRICRREE